VKQSTMQQKFQNNFKWNHKNKIAKIEMEIKMEA
jgi:hypothetical protein